MKYFSLIIIIVLLNACHLNKKLFDCKQTENVISDLVVLSKDSDIDKIDFSKYIDFVNVAETYQRHRIVFADSLMDSNSIYFRNAFDSLKINETTYMKIKENLLSQKVYRTYVTSDFIFFVQGGFLDLEYGFLYCLTGKEPTIGDRYLGRNDTGFKKVKNDNRWFMFSIRN